MSRMDKAKLDDIAPTTLERHDASAPTIVASRMRTPLPPPSPTETQVAQHLENGTQSLASELKPSALPRVGGVGEGGVSIEEDTCKTTAYLTVTTHKMLSALASERSIYENGKITKVTLSEIIEEMCIKGMEANKCLS